MKACLTLRWRSACTTAGYCRASPIAPNHAVRFSSTQRQYRRNNASPIISESSAQTDGLAIDPEGKKVRTDAGELPLSPVMDPAYWEATTRHQKKKAKAGKPVNSVEKQFRKSAFANALGTPLRICALTRTRLPSFFLQDFSLVSHPETGNPWWIPRSLGWDESAKSQETSETTAPGDEEATGEDNTTGEGGSVEGSEAGAPPAVRSNRPAPSGPRAYTLARRDLIAAIGKEGSGFQSGQYSLCALMKSDFARLGRQAIWRQGMDSVVLERIQQDIVRDLIYLGRLCTEEGRHYIAKCYGWDDVQYKHQGAVLWFDDTPKSEGTSEPEPAPGLLATYDVAHFQPGVEANATLAVHNMPLLLGAENIAKLKQETLFNDGSLFMLAGRRTTHVQQQLWRLQGYLVDPESP
ncbi:hypothetical protein F5Y17DRAFT_455673 [Xylariaceae sp. FL0594]|nr:hypothetical protein F5Y17DRAFT_455673 [Xylariaceae sp. FL0594]